MTAPPTIETAMGTILIAQALFTALAAQDDDGIRRLCAPGMIVRQNGGPTMGLDALIAFNHAAHAVARDLTYRNPVRLATAHGFVEEHDVCGTLPDGSALKLPVCVVADVVGGRVTSVREYFDSAAATALAAALADAPR